MKKVLITGATGFVGANVLRYLVKEGKFDVHIITKETSNKWRIKDVLTNVSEHQVDLIDYEKLKEIAVKISPDYIFHLAMYGGYSTVEKDDNKILNTNIIGTYNLLKATMEIPYKCFINTGTISEYGAKSAAMKETDCLEPNTLYGVSKAASTMLCQQVAKEYKKPITTLRLFSVYGYYEYKERFRLIPDVILHCLKNKDLNLSAGNQKRDFIFIEDVIKAYIKAANNPNKKGLVLNVGTGVDNTIRDVAERIVSKLNSRIKLNYDAKKSEVFENSVSCKADISEIKSVLDWKPDFDLDKGLERTISWFKSNLALYDQ